MWFLLVRIKLVCGIGPFVPMDSRSGPARPSNRRLLRRQIRKTDTNTKSTLAEISSDLIEQLHCPVLRVELRRVES